MILFSFLLASAHAGFYLDLSGGVLHRELNGDTGNYKSSQSFGSEFSVGHIWKNWDFALEGTYTIGRQKNLSQTFGGTTITDDYNWQGFFVGPTLKYHVLSSSGNWSWAPFAGVYYNNSSFDNSADFRVTNTTYDSTYDNDQEMWGYGAKLGVQFKQFMKNSSWLDAVTYKVFGSYTRHRETEVDYINGSNVLTTYNDNTPDRLNDLSIGLLVGMSFGEKTFSKVKSLFN